RAFLPTREPVQRGTRCVPGRGSNAQFDISLTPASQSGNVVGVRVPFWDVREGLLGSLAPSPVALHLPLFDIRWYGLAYIISLLWLWWYCASTLSNSKLWRFGPPPLTQSELARLMFWLAIGLIGGAKAGYSIAHFDSNHGLAWMLAPWNGGMSSFGGIAGVALAAALFCWSRSLSLLATIDALAIGAPISILFIRVGN